MTLAGSPPPVATPAYFHRTWATTATNEPEEIRPALSYIARHQRDNFWEIVDMLGLTAEAEQIRDEYRQSKA